MTISLPINIQANVHQVQLSHDNRAYIKEALQTAKTVWCNVDDDDPHVRWLNKAIKQNVGDRPVNYIACLSADQGSDTTPRRPTHHRGLGIAVRKLPMCIIGGGCRSFITLKTNIKEHFHKTFGSCTHSSPNSVTQSRMDYLALLLHQVKSADTVVGWTLDSVNNPFSTFLCARPLPDLTFTTTPDVPEEQAFPTDSAEKKRDAKRAAKAAGEDWVVNKRPKFIEDHKDDCGESLDGLGIGTEDCYLHNSISSEDSSISDQDRSVAGESEPDSEPDPLTGLEQFTLFGSGHDKSTYPDTTKAVENLDIFLHLLAEPFNKAKTGKLDLLELCGGEGLPGKIAVRRRLASGGNLDLVTNVDLNCKVTQKRVLDFIFMTKPLVVVMSPTCTPFGPWANLNKIINLQTWQQSYDQAAPHGRFCGTVAWVQLKSNRHFVAENPFPSKLFEESPWPYVLQHPKVSIGVLDQCATGLRGFDGLLAKKPTQLVASDPSLLEPFKDLRCSGCHQHSDTQGHTKQLQKWTNDFARRIIDGICLLKRRLRLPKADRLQAFPSAAAGPGEGENEEAPVGQPLPANITCEACTRRMHIGDHRHTRVEGSCLRWMQAPHLWDCPACIRGAPRAHPHHTMDGTCRVPTMSSRATHKKRGRHPREPQPVADEDPTAGAQPPTADDEQRIIDTVPQDRPVEGATSSSSGDRAPRGPDVEPRERRTWKESSSGPAHPENWTTFDVNRTMRALRIAKDGERQLLVKKLHIRWWHATTAQMTNIFKLANQPSEVIDLVKDVVDTCKVCREWSKPLPTTQSSVELATTFNQQVECDLMFYEKHIILHMVDRATRWHAALEVQGRTMEHLIAGIDACWVGLHGPMKEFIMDGETAIAQGWESRDYFTRKGITVHIRAPQQHARFIERRGALLREHIHRIDSQLRTEGIPKGDIPFPQRLSESVFAGNALLSINATTPYNSIYGRVPNILPDINKVPTAHESVSGAIRHADRLREISIQTMVERTAQERVNRALATRSQTAAQHRFKEGDFVDYFRPPTQKDMTGWTGPAKIVDITDVHRGTIKCEHNGRTLICSPRDLRQHMAFISFLAAPHFGNHTTNAMQQVHQLINARTKGTVLSLGYIRNKSGWTLSKSTSTYRKGWQALQHIAEVSLSLTNIVTARLGQGVVSTTIPSEYTFSVMMSWYCNYPENITFHWVQPTNTFNFRQSFGKDWERVQWVQLLAMEDEEAMIKTTESPVSAPTAQTDVSTEVGRALETITEGSNEDESEAGSLIVCNTEDADLVKAGEEALAYLLKDDTSFRDRTVEEEVTYRPDLEVFPEVGYDSVEAPDDYYHVRAANVRAGLEPNAYLDHDECTELHYTGDAIKLVHPNASFLIATGATVVIKSYLADKKLVIERDTDLVTRDELVAHKSEVQAAICKELQTWQKYGCFSRQPRHGARNIVDCKWVIKWKQEILPDNSFRRIIRARLTIRGFKDMDAGTVQSYAGTCQRYSQRLLVSEAANRGWPLASTDISKAFLQGVTYEELAELTGEPLRNVNFYLPANSIEALKKLPGYGDFDPAKEVLHCDKPGTGSVDAPRAFHLKLAKVMREELGYRPTRTDAELLVLHKPRDRSVDGLKREADAALDDGDMVLIAICAIHVDDLKFAGHRAIIENTIKVLERTFGSLIVQWNNFTNCGIRHKQDPVSFEISLDQFQYAAALKKMIVPDLRSRPAEEVVTTEIFEQFRSLRGAVAYTLLTRADVAVYVVALQRRQPENTTYAHIKAINAVVVRLQTCPVALTYKKLGAVTSFITISDSAFKKEDDTGHAVKGVIILRVEHGKYQTGNCHVIDYVSKRIRFVTRSTFSSELFALCDACDYSMLLRQVMHEFTHAPLTATTARLLREGKLRTSVTIAIVIDALSVYAAITAAHIKTPADCSLLSHLQYVRELLDLYIIQQLIWSDTRDLLADGLTKGTVERTALAAAMAGRLNVEKEKKEWRSTVRSDTGPSAQSSGSAGYFSAPAEGTASETSQDRTVAGQGLVLLPAQRSGSAPTVPDYVAHHPYQMGMITPYGTKIHKHVDCDGLRKAKHIRIINVQRISRAMYSPCILCANGTASSAGPVLGIWPDGAAVNDHGPAPRPDHSTGPAGQGRPAEASTAQDSQGRPAEAKSATVPQGVPQHQEETPEPEPTPFQAFCSVAESDIPSTPPIAVVTAEEELENAYWTKVWTELAGAEDQEIQRKLREEGLDHVMIDGHFKDKRERRLLFKERRDKETQASVGMTALQRLHSGQPTDPISVFVKLPLGGTLHHYANGFGTTDELRRELEGRRPLYLPRDRCYFAIAEGRLNDTEPLRDQGMVENSTVWIIRELPEGYESSSESRSADAAGSTHHHSSSSSSY